jgi:hypothetical protein
LRNVHPACGIDGPQLKKNKIKKKKKRKKGNNEMNAVDTSGDHQI